MRASRGFTLIEILVVVAIIATMAGVGIASVVAGQGAARIKGATRDIFASIRHARSVALQSQQASVITYSERRDGEDIVAVVELKTAKIMSENGPATAKTLDGRTVRLDGEEEGDSRSSKSSSRSVKADSGTESTLTDGGGQTIGDILFSPISENILRGVRIKVVSERTTTDGTATTETAAKSKISAFSNVDYILGKTKELSTASDSSKSSSTDSLSSGTSGDSSGFSTGVVIGKAVEKGLVAEPLQEPVSFVFETNGRIEAHQIWIYPEGGRYDKGLSIRIDRFGAARVVSADERD